jgi:Na+-driven multidrug efflux pump
MMLLAIGNLAVYVVLAFVLIPRWAGEGAALAMTLTEAVSAIGLIAVVFAMLRRPDRYRPDSDDTPLPARLPTD